jgi:hypothetical protein
MKKYTVRYAHLEKESDKNIGEILKTGDIFGKMGNTGQSTAKHVHTDCIEGEVKHLYHQSDLYKKKYTPSPEQLIYFMVDNGLFGVKPVITTGYADVSYFITYKKVHYGYDVVPTDRHRTEDHHYLKWNRSNDGKVVAKGYDKKGYGHWINICFEA